MFRKTLVILTITAALALTASVIALAESARQGVSQSASAPAHGLAAAPRAPVLQDDEPDAPAAARGQRPPAADPTRASRAPAAPLAISLQGEGGGPFTNSIFFDDMESGLGSWTASGLWHSTTVTDTYGSSYNGSASAWYGQAATGDYNTGGVNRGALVAGPLTIPTDAPGAYLRFYSYEYTEDFLDEFDTRIVYTSTDATNWTPVFTSTESTAAWHEVQVDLGGSIGQEIYLKFEFDTVDDSYNNYPGWYIDDVAVGYDPLHVNNSVQINYALPGGATILPDQPYRSLKAVNFTGYTATFTVTSDSPLFSLGPTDFSLPPGIELSVFINAAIPDTEPLGAVYDNYLYYTATATTLTDTLTFSATQLARTLLGKLEAVDYTFYDDGRGQTVGNGNGLIDPGETISLTVDLQNYFDIAQYEVATGFNPLADVNWLDSLDYVGDLAAGTVFSNTQYLFSVSPLAARGDVFTFTLNTTARGGWAFTTLFTETVPYAVDLGPDQFNAAPPGETMTYTLPLTNGTGADDAFDLSVLTGTWTTTFSVDPTPVLTDGFTTTVEVYVEVPPGADWGDMDPITILAEGVGPSASYTEAVLLNSYAGLKLEGTSPTVNGSPLARTFPIGPLAAHLSIFSGDDDTLDAWFEGYNAATRSWEVIASQTDGGSGVLYDGPLSGDYEQARVRLNDTEQNDDISFDYFFVYVPTVGLQPIDHTLLGVPGSVVTFTQQLSNLTGSAYSYYLTATGQSWPTTFLSGTQPLTATPLLAAGESFTYTVAVAIPADPGGVLTDTATLHAREALDITYEGAARLQTRVLGQDWALGYADLYDPAAVLFDPLDGGDPSTLSSGRIEKREVALSAFSQGGTAVAWERYYQNERDFWVTEVAVAMVDSGGSLLWGPVLMADYSAANHEVEDGYPGVAIDPTSGNIGVVWEHYEYDPVTSRSIYNVHAAVLDPQGNFLRLPTALTDNQGDKEDYLPVIEAPRSGGFAVVWEHWPGSVGGESFYSQVLDSQGDTRHSASEIVITMGGMEPYDPRLVRLDDDRLLLLYTCYAFTPDVADVCAAPLDRSGRLASDPQNLTQLVPGPGEYEYAEKPDAVQLASGEIVVGWSQGPDSGYGYMVVDRALSVLTPPTLLDTGPVMLEDYLTRVSLAQDSYGRAVFAYTNQQFGQVSDEQSLYLALINPDGSQGSGGLYRQPQSSTAQMGYNGQAAGGMPAGPPLYYQFVPTILKPVPPPPPPIP